MPTKNPADAPTTLINTPPPVLPSHIKDLFAVKDLKLVALDPIILKCVTAGKCVHLTASGTIQLGTLLKNTEQVKKVFEMHFKDANWKLAILTSNTAVISKHYWQGYDRKLLLSVLQDSGEKRYWKIENSEKAEIVAKAFDRFNTSELSGITVPSNIPRFELWWKNGRFLSCNETLAQRFSGNSSSKAPIIKPLHIQNLKIFTDMLLDSEQIPALSFGTLLGWYRNCGMIPYTTDIDINVHVSQYSDEFVESLRNREDYRLLRFIGAKEHGLEITVKIPGSPGRVKNSRVDVFYISTVNASYDAASGTFPRGDDGWARLKYLIPKYTDKDLCTGDLMGHLFFVPCNFMDVIVAAYGKTGWIEPQENYNQLGEGLLHFWDGAWNKTLDNVLAKFNFTYEDY
ncbi:hypothetical protein L596_009578 [Steinernema carpocapsae]|uniref:Fukutin n=1 Tax=Steinernema carpocapsae TaxID=34508 RepID=A0A4U5PG99_STECR|nr:hypothetical protein L596_009578 [Steinernema carpocapsae]